MGKHRRIQISKNSRDIKSLVYFRSRCAIKDREIIDIITLGPTINKAIDSAQIYKQG